MKKLEKAKSNLVPISLTRPFTTNALKNDKVPHKKTFICHYCVVQGHIRPYCYKWLNKIVKDSKRKNFHDKGEPIFGRPTNVAFGSPLVLENKKIRQV